MQKGIPLMQEVMTVSPRAVAADAPLSEAAHIMTELGIHHLPVTDAGDVISVVSDRDIMRISIPARPIDADGLVIRDICQQRAYAADVNDPLDRVLDVMVDKRISSVLVMREGELAGIFTATDACRLLAATLRGASE